MASVSNQRDQWVIEGILEGHIIVPREDNLLPITEGSTALTSYAILQQNLLKPIKKTIFLGLNIPKDADPVCVAYQEMEAFIRALSIEKNVPISVEGILSMTKKQEEWPADIGFIDAREFPQCLREWEPVNHHIDPKNRVKWGGGIYLVATTRNLDSLETRHNVFCRHDEYSSELVKDYIAGLEVERIHPSLSLLYFFHVLERYYKQEFENPPQTMNKGTLRKLIKCMGNKLTPDEQKKAKFLLKWRHTKSEAHLAEMGTPTQEELRLCKKMARFYLDLALSLSQVNP